MGKQKENEQQRLLDDTKKGTIETKELEISKQDDGSNKKDNASQKTDTTTAVKKHDRKKKQTEPLQPGTFLISGKDKKGKPNKVVYDKRSLFIFSYKLKPRQFLVKLMHWGPFDTFITVVILLNSLMLAAQDFGDRLDPDYVSERNKVLGDIDKGFTCVFLMEFLIKVVSMGFIVHKNAYLRDAWNWLDFFVVAISIPDLLPGVDSNSSLKALRTFRILRPLRSINSMPRMKELITALFASLPGLASVVLFLMFAFGIFGIFGVHQFSGSLYLRCRMTEEPVMIDEVLQWPINFDADWLCSTDADCARMLGEGVLHKCGALIEYDLPLATDMTKDQELISYGIVGFDNLAHGMLTIFQVLTLEGWSGLMYNYMDSNSSVIAIFFLCIIVIFGSFFALNLVLAQIMNSFYEQTDQIKRKKEEAEQQELEEKQKALQELENKSGLNEDQSQSFLNNVSKTALHPEEEKDKLPALNSPQSKNKNVQFAMHMQQVEQNSRPYDPRQSIDSSEQQIHHNDTHQQLRVEQNKRVDIAGNDQSFTANKEESAKIPTSIRIQNASDNQDIPEINSDQEENVKEKDQADEVVTQSLYYDEQEHEKKSRLRSKKNCLFRGCYLLVSNPFFNFFIFLLIIANTVVLALDGYPQSEQKTKTLATLNDFFTIAFLVEMILKLIGLGFKNYVKDSFNLFDGIVVVLSLIDFCLTASLDAESLGSASEAFAAFRACRLLRVIKIARAWKELQEILRKTLKSMKDISYFSILLGLYMYIFALLGMELFANKIRYTAEGDLVYDLQADDIVVTELDAPRTSFDGIFYSLTTIFIVIIGEDWNWVMYDYVRLLGQWYSLYFVSLMILGNTMLLSLFTAILLQNFEEKEEKDEDEDEDMALSMMSQTQPKRPFKVVFSEKWANFKEEAYLSFGGKKRVNLSDKTSNVDKKNDTRIVPVDDKENKIGEKKNYQQEQAILEQQLITNHSVKQRHKSSRMIHYSALNYSKQNTKKRSIHDIKGRSLCLFSTENKFRMFMVNLCKHPWFDNFILLLIIISTVMLAIETPLDNPNGQKLKILEQMDYVMTGLFTLELVIKVISYGFLCNGRYSYLKNAWNILDFIIVVSSLLSAFPSGLDLSFIKVLRVLRVLRPLRVISKNKDLKVAITSLFNSLPAVINLELVVLFFTFLLAILGTTLFGGKFYYCDTEESALSASEAGELVKTKWDCYNYGGEWVNPDLHFDNTIYSMLTLITIQTTEGWIDVMWNSADMTGIDMQPQLLASWWYIILFMVLIIILCLLFLNLFVGVVIETFNEEKEKLTWNHLLKIMEREYIQVQLMIYSAKPLYKINLTGNCCRDFCIHITQNTKFETFIMICICLNTALLGVQWYNMDEEIEEWVSYFNYVFMAIFTIEAILKIIAMKMKYFKDSWNIFDFIVVVGTIIVLAISFSSTNADVSTQSTILRSLRIGRVFRLVKRAKQLQIIFQTLIVSLPSLGSLGVLLVLLLFLYAIIGVYLFATVQLQEELNYHANFQTFINGFLTLMRCSTGEAWNAIMFDSGRSRDILFQCDKEYDYETYVANGFVTTGCGKFGASIAYFLSFQILVSQIFLNLFIAIIVDTYIEYTQKGDLPIIDQHVEDFTNKWMKYDPDATGYIFKWDLEHLLVDLATTNANENWLHANKVNLVKSRQFRLRFIAFLEVPTYGKLRKYMFYDVMQTLAKFNFETKYYKDTYVRKQSTITPQDIQVEKEAREIDMAPYDSFTFIVEQILEKDERIELVQSLKSKATNVGKKFHAKIDSGISEGECYDSSHVIYGDVILRWLSKVQSKESQTCDREIDANSKPTADNNNNSTNVQNDNQQATTTTNDKPASNSHVLEVSADDPQKNGEQEKQKQTIMTTMQQQSSRVEIDQSNIDHSHVQPIQDNSTTPNKDDVEPTEVNYNAVEPPTSVSKQLEEEEEQKVIDEVANHNRTQSFPIKKNSLIETDLIQDKEKLTPQQAFMDEKARTIDLSKEEVLSDTSKAKLRDSVESDLAQEIVKNANKASISKNLDENNDPTNQLKNELEDVLSSSQQ